MGHLTAFFMALHLIEKLPTLSVYAESTLSAIAPYRVYTVTYEHGDTYALPSWVDPYTVTVKVLFQLKGLMLPYNQALDVDYKLRSIIDHPKVRVHLREPRYVPLNCTYYVYVRKKHQRVKRDDIPKYSVTDRQKLVVYLKSIA